jgi:ribonuclease Z
MELTFLGTGSAMPTRQRNVSAVVLRLPQRRQLWLFDCGEATQHQLLRTSLRPPQIRRVFLTHLHGDHLYGLPGLLTSLSMLGVETPVDVHGPAGLREVVEVTLGAAQAACTFPLRVHELAAGVVVEEAGLRVRCLPLEHGVPCFGFRVEEAPRPGRFDAARAAALGVGAGPDFGVLKRGGSVALPGARGAGAGPGGGALRRHPPLRRCRRAGARGRPAGARGDLRRGSPADGGGAGALDRRTGG